MKYYRSLKIIIILCFFSFQINAKDEVLRLAITTTAENSGSNRFFLDAIISSFNLILDIDATLFNIVITSLKVSFTAVFIASLIGIPLGIIVALNEFGGKKLLMVSLNTLMALPTVVIGLILYGILNRQGLLGDMALLYTPVAIIVGLCILVIPIIWNLTISAVSSTDPRLINTCK